MLVLLSLTLITVKQRPCSFFNCVFLENRVVEFHLSWQRAHTYRRATLKSATRPAPCTVSRSPRRHSRPSVSWRKPPKNMNVEKTVEERVYIELLLHTQSPLHQLKLSLHRRVYLWLSIASCVPKTHKKRGTLQNRGPDADKFISTSDLRFLVLSCVSQDPSQLLTGAAVCGW